MKDKKVLIIDTTDSNKIKVGIEIGNKTKFITSERKELKSQAVIPLIDKLLSINNLSLSDITEINVNEGPGSFTGIKIGAAIANTLGFFLKIPINNRKVGELVVPRYNK